MGLISYFLSDPRGALIALLLMLPGYLFAMSMHEYAHARMAYRHGDNTAQMLGRMTLNPLAHIDPVGLFMLFAAGFGWAKPVPVNPRNYKGDFRKADIMVSIAGIAANLLMFLIGSFVLCAALGVAIAQLGAGAELSVREILRNAPSFGAYMAGTLWGDVAYYLYLILLYFVQINIVLAVFNLIPLPPLDGYHVLNDLVLKRDLFASPRASMIASGVLILLLVTGRLSFALSFVIDKAYWLVGTVADAALRLIGLL